MATAYWEDRVKLAQRAIDRRDNILINKLSGSFDRINRQLNNDIGKIISTYTRKTGLTPEQAFKYLNEGLPQNVRNELLAKIQTVTSARERGKLETIMRTDRYQDRITRMDAIKADTRIALTKNAEVQIGEVTNHLKKTAQESYARSMFDIQKASGYAFSPHGVSADSINKILRTPWSGSTYSSRIWKAKDVMASNLDSVMTEMFSMGKLSDKTLKDLQGAVSFDKWKQQATSKFKNETQYAKYNVQRLIRTETNYVANAADAEAYEECDIEKYEFIAVLDLRTSAVCQQHDGKVYSMAEKEEGVNFPPLHPFCRSSVAPSLDSVNRSELQRRARDPETGKNVLIPADMNYNEWKAWVADGSPDIDGWRGNFIDTGSNEARRIYGKIINSEYRVDLGDKYALTGGRAGTILDIPKNDSKEVKVYELPKCSGFVDGKFVFDENKNTIYTDGRMVLNNSTANADMRIKIKSIVENEIDVLSGVRKDGLYYRTTQNKKEIDYLKKGSIKASVNHASGETESGLSVWETPKYGNKITYIVKGDVIDVGSDGEPVLDIKTLKFVRETSDSEIASMRVFGKDAFIKNYKWDENQVESAIKGNVKKIRI